MKTCTKCKIAKPQHEYHNSKIGVMGKKPRCKQCAREQALGYTERNKERIRERSKEWYRNNKERKLASNKAWKQANKEYYSTKQSEYAKENREKIVERKRIARNKDPLVMLRYRVRSRLKNALLYAGVSKDTKTFKTIGCTPDFLKEYLEGKFLEGMSWENRGEWHIDHIVPLASATSTEELLRLCHYTNLQVLWAEDNLRKGARLG